jgi:23S rRNA pseudouridine2604 synthase
MNNELTNLNKYISSSGFCSRRDADKLIEQARVTINGELVLPGARVGAGDVVDVDGEPLKTSKKKPIYIAFNKPVGVTSTTDIHDKSNLIYFIGHPKRIFPIGRLDKDSDGLIFLTNDGDIVNKILRASNNHEKEYIVTVDKLITPDFTRQMAAGVPVERKMTKPCFVRQEGGRRFRIILTQGLNRQIRKMCEYLGYKVVSLSRVRIMNVELANLPVGKWRYFTLPEIEKLNMMVSESSKTDSEPKGKKAVQYIPKKKKTDSDGDERPVKTNTGKAPGKVPAVKGKKTIEEKHKLARAPRTGKVMGEKSTNSRAGKLTDFRSKKKRS